MKILLHCAMQAAIIGIPYVFIDNAPFVGIVLAIVVLWIQNFVVATFVKDQCVAVATECDERNMKAFAKLEAQLVHCRPYTEIEMNVYFKNRDRFIEKMSNETGVMEGDIMDVFYWIQENHPILKQD